VNPSDRHESDCRTMRSAEFFAGMGLVRAGLERCGIETVFANDVDKTKASLYRDNWGDDVLIVDDICSLTGDQVPTVDVATSSFPCVDLSLAGNRVGLAGERSGLVFEFCRVLEEMGPRAPRAVMIENVTGFLTAKGGNDFRAVIHRLNELEYSTETIVVNASAFVPQSRARVFILGCRGRDVGVPPPPPPRRNLRLADIASHCGDWWKGKRLEAFLSSLSPLQAKRLESYRKRKKVGWFGAYRRTRAGRAVWEIRSDELAGALRTTRGGSSRQAIVRAGQGAVKVRWMDLREYARLQGADDLRYGAVSERQAMFALGDAVCVPVVEWIGRNWLCKVLQ